MLSGELRSLPRKAWRVLRERGLHHTLIYAGSYLWELTPWGRRRWDVSEFDRAHGVDTAGKIPIRDLAVQSASADSGVGYQAISPDGFRQMMAAIEADVAGWTFVDLGAGKGRALLLAAEHPFARIVGVEFSERLCEVARANVRRYRNPAQRCRTFEVLCTDAAAYPIPAGPAVVHLYNPFHEDVVARVLENLERSLEAEPRELLVLYYDPVSARLFERSPRFELAAREPHFAIYRAMPEQ
jgi:SAM-dependent methyltransferase